MWREGVCPLREEARRRSHPPPRPEVGAAGEGRRRGGGARRRTLAGRRVGALGGVTEERWRHASPVKKPSSRGAHKRPLPSSSPSAAAPVCPPPLSDLGGKASNLNTFWHLAILAAMIPVLLFLWGTTLTHPVLAAQACYRPPLVPFATIDVSKEEYHVGEEIVYICNPGYIHRSGPRKYICPLSGRWPSISMTCIPRTCSYPGPLLNGNIQHTELTYPNFVNFSCLPGFNLQGPKTSQCMADGQWSAKLPQCQSVRCPPPPISEFSALTYRRVNPGDISVFQDEITFECLSPLALFGNEKAFCQADGSWSEIPECRSVECPQPQGIENGFINFALHRTYHYKQIVTYGCNDPYTLDGPRDSRCEKTGQWSAKPTCRASCQIPVKRATVLYNDQKLKVQDDLQNGIRHAETIWFFCKNKEHQCSYKEPAQCMDGVLTPPACFKERSWFISVFKTDIADLTPCENIN